MTQAQSSALVSSRRRLWAWRIGATLALGVSASPVRSVVQGAGLAWRMGSVPKICTVGSRSDEPCSESMVQ